VHFGFVSGFILGIPLLFLHPRLPTLVAGAICGAIIGWVTNWLA